MKINKKHICHLVYSFDVGGLERIIVNCINNLDHDKFDHTIISLTHIGAFISEIDVPVKHFSINKKHGNDLSVYYRLYKLLTKINPDVLHTYNLGTIEYQWVAMFARVPLRVHAEHGRDSYDPNGAVKKYQLLRKLCSYSIHKIVAVSQDLTSWLSKDVGISKKKLRLIVNGIDTHYFQPGLVEIDELKSFSDKFVFGHVARLHEIKNQTLMLESFLIACQSSERFNNDCVLVVVGDGPDRKKLKQFVDDAPILKDKVLFVGSRTNVRDYYYRFDAFLMSSVAEGIPMTLLESMSMAVPHLVTSVGGITEVIREKETGISVPSDNTSAYVKGLVELYENNEQRLTMSNNARKQIVEHFSQKIMMAAYQDIYLEKDELSDI